MAKANEPIRVGAFTLKNRLTMAPTVKFDYTDARGLATDVLVEHYRERAAGGCALICVEATAITPDGRFGENHMGLWNDEQMESQKKIVDAIHAGDAVAIIQLNHTGISGNPAMGRIIGPSAVKTRDGSLSAEMTLDEIHTMQKAYLDAAVRAKKAGYDGVQLHACHSYLINQFASPLVNLRTDAYGGSTENRARFGAEIIKMIREACGPDFLISARISGYEGSLEESLGTGEAYVAAGCDYLQVSCGIDDLSTFRHDEMLPCNAVAELGVRFHAHFGDRIPTSSVNEIMTPEDVHALLEPGLVDTIDFGRAVLADPEIANATLNGTPYVKCFDCKRCQYGPFTDHRCPAAMLRAKAKNA